MSNTVKLDVSNRTGIKLNFIPVPKYPGYYINTDSKHVYSIKSGSLRLLNKQRAYRRYDVPSGFDVYNKGQKRRLTAGCIDRVIAEHKEEPKALVSDSPLSQRSDTWWTIVNVLDEVAPDWHDNGASGSKAATNTIRLLAEKAKEKEKEKVKEFTGSTFLEFDGTMKNAENVIDSYIKFIKDCMNDQVAVQNIDFERGNIKVNRYRWV